MACAFHYSLGTFVLVLMIKIGIYTTNSYKLMNIAILVQMIQHEEGRFFLFEERSK